MIEKARGRLTTLFKSSASIPEDQKDEIKKVVNKGEAWKGISDTEFAKEFISFIKGIEVSTYSELSSLILGDLTEYRENPTKLLAYIEQRQGRLILLRHILDSFVPDSEQVLGMLSDLEEPK